MHHLFNKKQHFCLLFWINKGYNPLSKIEIVSGLNLFNQGRAMYYYYIGNCTQKYNPKVYLGTSQTIALSWNGNNQTGINYPSIWPEVKPQKGEANINNKYSSKYIRNIYILI